MAWQDDISALLQEAQDISVRFDIEQQLTEQEKAQARNNIGFAVTSTNLEKHDYKITFNN